MSNQWFRFYAEVLEDPKVQSLTPKYFKIWVNLLCLACKNGGVLPSVKDVAFSLRMTNIDTKSALSYLKSCGLLDQSTIASDCYEIHSWKNRQYKSDVSTERVKRFRNGKCNDIVTPPDTEADTETDTIQSAGASFSKVYEEGSKCFPALASANSSLIAVWIESGCDPDRDIIPEIRRNIGKQINAWKYFTQAVMDAKATRLTPLPPGNPRASPNGFKSFDRQAIDSTALAIQEVLRNANPS